MMNGEACGSPELFFSPGASPSIQQKNADWEPSASNLHIDRTSNVLDQNSYASKALPGLISNYLEASLREVLITEEIRVREFFECLISSIPPAFRRLKIGEILRSSNDLSEKDCNDLLQFLLVECVASPVPPNFENNDSRLESGRLDVCGNQENGRKKRKTNFSAQSSEATSLQNGGDLDLRLSSPSSNSAAQVSPNWYCLLSHLPPKQRDNVYSIDSENVSPMPARESIIASVFE